MYHLHVCRNHEYALFNLYWKLKHLQENGIIALFPGTLEANELCKAIQDHKIDFKKSSGLVRLSGSPFHSSSSGPSWETTLPPKAYSGEVETKILNDQYGRWNAKERQQHSCGGQQQQQDRQQQIYPCLFFLKTGDFPPMAPHKGHVLLDADKISIENDRRRSDLPLESLSLPLPSLPATPEALQVVARGRNLKKYSVTW